MSSQIELALLRLFAECNDCLPVGESFTLEAGNRILRLSVEPIANNPPIPETSCEEDVYDAARILILLHERRVTAKEILAELEAVGRIWGRSTVMAALASLTSKGLLKNPRDRHGYGLTVQTNT